MSGQRVITFRMNPIARSQIEKCPTCADRNIRCHGEQSDTGTRFEYMGCLFCGARWTVFYEFSGFVVTQESRVAL